MAHRAPAKPTAHDRKARATAAPALPRLRVRDLAAATPEHRNRYVDLLRAVSIVVVVVGHWLAAAVTVTDGSLGGVNVLAALPWTHPLTWALQVMPVVFLVGGYANAASLTAYHRAGGPAAAWVRSRALRLLGPTAVFLIALGAGYAAARALGADQDVTRRAVSLAGISLWFLVVYLAVVALAPPLLVAQRRWRLAVPLALFALVVLGDTARLITGSNAAAAVNYLAGWLAVHQLGVAWHDGALTASRRTPITLAVGGLGLLLLLTGPGPYAVTMVGAAVPPELGNTAPPTVALMALAVAQAGAVLLLRGVGNRWLARRRVWTAVVSVNAVALTVYLWHMVPVVLAGAALVATGLFPQPPVGSGTWFALRVPWLVVLAALLLALIIAVARWETPVPRRPGSGSVVGVGVGVTACLLALAGLGVGGADGILPGVAGLPLLELTAFAAGFAILWLPARARCKPASPEGGTPEGAHQ